jgi:hypothetical protein
MLNMKQVSRKLLECIRSTTPVVDSGAGGDNDLQDPRLRSAGNDGKFSLGNKFHAGPLSRALSRANGWKTPGVAARLASQGVGELICVDRLGGEAL